MFVSGNNNGKKKQDKNVGREVISTSLISKKKRNQYEIKKQDKN